MLYKIMPMIPFFDPRMIHIIRRFALTLNKNDIPNIISMDAYNNASK